MGYRFSLETANTVANLSFGKVMSCYRDIYSSEENYTNFMIFLEQFHKNIFSNKSSEYIRNINIIRETLLQFEDYRRHIEHVEYNKTFSRFEDYKHHIEQVEYNKPFLYFHEAAIASLHNLSEVFNRCRVKSLILPPVSGYNDAKYDFITSHRTFNRIIRMHEGDSCLILQPEECPTNTSIFDAFPNFDVALRQVDLWTAVMFWDDEDFAFVPVRTEAELMHLYKIVKYDRFPIGEIKRYANQKAKPSHYIFQLSDLHFGSKNSSITERRLKTLIEKQMSSFNIEDTVSFIITGDAVDTPTYFTENQYKNFEDFLRLQSGSEPIRVLGNHDVNQHGISFFNGRQKIAHFAGSYPKIHKLEEHKTLLLLFNSNTNGSLAEGEIGINQMAEMGNLLDKINNVEKYTLIAVLHHHLLPVPKPNYYQRKWYEKFIPDELMDGTLKLKDADLFLEWLSNRNVKYVLHGHKHIPFKSNHNDITVIGCGSSTGEIRHKEKGKTYLSYNLIKISNNSVVCTYFAEDVLGSGAKDISLDITKC